jgi:hypothetical protein
MFPSPSPKTGNVLKLPELGLALPIPSPKTGYQKIGFHVAKSKSQNWQGAQVT